MTDEKIREKMNDMITDIEDIKTHISIASDALLCSMMQIADLIEEWTKMEQTILGELSEKPDRLMELYQLTSKASWFTEESEKTINQILNGLKNGGLSGNGFRMVRDNEHENYTSNMNEARWNVQRMICMFAVKEYFDEIGE